MSIQDVCDLTLQEDFDLDQLLEQNQELLRQNKHLRKEIFFLKEKNVIFQSDIKKLENKCLYLQERLNSSNTDNAVKLYEVTHNMNVKPVSSNSVSKVPVCDLHERVMTETFGNAVIKLEKNHKKLCDTSESKISNCSSKQEDREISILEALNLFNINAKNVQIQQSKDNVYSLQNNSHINELLLELKVVIEDIENIFQKSDFTIAMPHICHLKRIRNCLEKMLHNEINKLKNHVNFDKLVENCVICLKKSMSKQEDIINSLLEEADLSVEGSKSLHSKIMKLKDLLLACGFLKFESETKNESKNIFPLNAITLSNLSDTFICDIAHDPMLKRIIVPLLPALNLSFSKLINLSKKWVELQFILNDTEILNNNLISRVQDQEIHLKGVTKEIEEAQHIVSALKNEHKKLQYAEGILKYDLQEKRKLLTRLREQLENTREDFSRVRIKNSKSEAEWQDLHNEFLQRQKQSNAESDFLEDKYFESHEKENHIQISTAPDKFFEDHKKINKLHNSTASGEYLVSESTETISTDVPHTKTRLELLEEQCQNLYSSLLLSSSKRQIIDEHLENLCQRIEKRNKIRSKSFSSHCSNAGDEKDTEIALLKCKCHGTTFKCNELANSSDKLQSLCKQTMSPNNYHLNSSKIDSFVPSLSELSSDIQLSTTIEQIPEGNCSINSGVFSSCNQEPHISSETIGLTVNNKNIHLKCISSEDSVSIEKKDTENCYNLENVNEIKAVEEKKVN